MKNATITNHLTPSVKLPLPFKKLELEINTNNQIFEPIYNCGMESNKTKIIPLTSTNSFPMKNLCMNSKLLSARRKNNERVFNSKTALNKSLPLRKYTKSTKDSKRALKENIIETIQGKKNKLWKALIRCVNQRPPLKRIVNMAYKNRRTPLHVNISLPKIRIQEQNKSLIANLTNSQRKMNKRSMRDNRMRLNTGIGPFVNHLKLL